MEDAAIGVEYGFMHCFGKRRVWEDSLHEIGFGRFQCHRNAINLYKLGDYRADHMCADKFARFWVKDAFNKAACLSKRDCLAIRLEGEMADLHLMPLLFRFCFGKTDARDL